MSFNVISNLSPMLGCIAIHNTTLTENLIIRIKFSVNVVCKKIYKYIFNNVCFEQTLNRHYICIDMLSLSL